jgi:hypothetical protein
VPRRLTTGSELLLVLKRIVLLLVATTIFTREALLVAELKGP